MINGGWEPVGGAVSKTALTVSSRRTFVDETDKPQKTAEKP